MIESYDFGRIVIDGKEYTQDVIIYPDRVNPNWWRKRGHELNLQDIQEIFEAKPETLVVGTGYSGLMHVLPETRKQLESQGIELIIEDSKKACQTYNDLCKSKKVIAALHLTC